MTRFAFLVTASLASAVVTLAARLPLNPPPAPAVPTPVLAELFTSEGCSSCPPADLLLAALGQEQSIDGALVVMLSEHVNYWDHQGWKDPFSSPQFTQRQQVYGRRFNLDGVYTPQLVVDGAVEMVGSDDIAVRAAVAKAARAPKPAMRVSVTKGQGDTLLVSVDGDALADPNELADIRIALAEDDLVVDVKRGENASRTLRHMSVVRQLVDGSAPPAGRVTSSGALTIAPGVNREKLRVVAFAQERKHGRVLSIGWVKAF